MHAHVRSARTLGFETFAGLPFDQKASRKNHAMASLERRVYVWQGETIFKYTCYSADQLACLWGQKQHAWNTERPVQHTQLSQHKGGTQIAFKCF